MNDGFRSNHWFRSERAKVGNRRNLAVAARSAEVPSPFDLQTFTIVRCKPVVC
jgi:hypothetical protein